MDHKGKIRIRFTDNLKKTEPVVLRAIASVGPISVKDIYLADGSAFITLFDPNDLPKLLTKEAKETLASLHMRCAISDSYPDRTVFITRIRSFVNNYEDEEILDSLNSCNSFQVERVFKVKRRNYRPGQTISLKALMATANDVNKIMSEGVKFLDMRIPPDWIFKEDAVQVTQCFRCFSFSHNTKQCSNDKLICSNCGGLHNYRQCTATESNCPLCGGDHIAIARHCPARKAHIKDLIEIRKTKQSEQRNNVPKQSAPSQQQPQQPIPTTSKNSLPIHHSTPKSANKNLVPPQANLNNSNNNPSADVIKDFKKHSWEIKLSVMKSYAEMVSQGDTTQYVIIMNEFLEDHEVPGVYPRNLNLNKNNNSNKKKSTKAKPKSKPKTYADAATSQSPKLFADAATASTPKTCTDTASSPIRPAEIVNKELPELSPIPGTQTQAIPQRPGHSTPIDQSAETDFSAEESYSDSEHDASHDDDNVNVDANVHDDDNTSTHADEDENGDNSGSESEDQEDVELVYESDASNASDPQSSSMARANNVTGDNTNCNRRSPYPLRKNK